MYSSDYVELARHLTKLGLSLRVTARYLSVAKSSVHRWLRTDRRQKALTSPKHPPTIFHSLVSEFPFFSLSVYRAKLAADTRFDVSKTTIWRWLKRLGYNKARTYPSGSSTQVSSEKRKEFTNMASQKEPDDIICIDETSWYVTAIPRRGWKRPHVRLRVPMVRTTGRRHSLILATTRKGNVYWQLHPGSINSAIFSKFLLQLPQSWEEKLY